MNVFNVLGTFFDVLSGFLISKYLENDMKKETTSEVKKYTKETN